MIGDTILRVFSVHHCPNCGSAGRMIMKPGVYADGIRATGFSIPKLKYPLLSVPVNKSLLEATTADKTALHLAAVQQGFVCVGFHGTGSNHAESILQGIRDVSTAEARGKGFAVGSKYDGLPTTWAAQCKGGGTPTILRIYVKHFHIFDAGDEFDWGKMDPDDSISVEGLEMVLRPAIFSTIVALPSISVIDQSLVPADLWDDCPKHSFRRNEIVMMTAIAQRMGWTLDRLEENIEKPEYKSTLERLAGEYSHLAAADSDSD